MANIGYARNPVNRKTRNHVMPTGIEKAIEAAGSKAALGAAIGVNARTVWMWSRLGYVPPLSVPAVAQATGVPILELERPTTPRGRILAYLAKHDTATVGELMRRLKLQNTTVRVQIAGLLRQGIIAKQPIAHRTAQDAYFCYHLADRQPERICNGQDQD
jgi:hypothetical protein